MSQVIVEEDNLVDKRVKSREQERHIQRDAAFAKWRKGGTQGLDLILKATGIAFIPIVFVWGILLAGVGLAISVVGRIMNALGRLFRRG